MAKLTAQDLIRMAAAQGIMLVEAGSIVHATTAHNANAEFAEVVRAREGAFAQIKVLRNQLTASVADVNKWRQAYEGMRTQRQEPANGAELQAARDALTRAIRERDEARTRSGTHTDNAIELREAHARDRAALMEEGRRLSSELSEARAQVIALERTVAKLRPSGAPALPAPVAIPTTLPTIRVTFDRFPGWAIVETLRTFGTWNKREGIWLLRDTPEARTYVESVRGHLSVPPITERDAPNRRGHRDPGEDAADRFHDRIDRQ
jgi:hypothetical protein